MKNVPCLHRTLAASTLCRVEACEHGTIHLVLGDLTLRMKPNELSQVSDDLATAVSLLQIDRVPSQLC